MIRRGFLKALTVGLAASFIPRRAAVARPVVPVLPGPPMFDVSGSRALYVKSHGPHWGHPCFRRLSDALAHARPGDVIYISKDHVHVSAATRA